MTRTRSVFILGFIAIGLAVVLGCLALPASKPPWWKPKPPVTVTYTVVEPCDLMTETGQKVEKLGVRERKPIKWVNHTQHVVTIVFEPPTLVGREDVFLNPGESYVTTITRMPPKGEKPSITVLCDREPEMIANTPDIKICPPEPEECP